MKIKEYITNSPEETFALGKKISKTVSSGGILALIGELGGGKTVFVKGLALGLGIKNQILSPTFNLIKEYEISKKEKVISKKSAARFYHLDLYRIIGTKEVLGLGLKEILENKKNIVAIEWAERAKKILPQETIWVEFSYLRDNKRKIIIKK